MLVEERSGGTISEVEWEFSKGCNIKVTTLFHLSKYF